MNEEFKVKIKVTEHHIDTANCHAGFCPIALAIKEAFGVKRGDMEFVEVDADGVVWFKDRHVDLSEYAKEAELFIQQYDHWSNASRCLEVLGLNHQGECVPRGGRGRVRPKSFEFELKVEDE